MGSEIMDAYTEKLLNEFLHDFFSDDLIRAEISNRIKAGKQFREQEAQTKLGDKIGFNAGKELEHVLATTIKKVMKRQVAIKDELPDSEVKINDYKSYIDLIIDSSLQLSVKSKSVKDINEVKEVIIFANDYGDNYNDRLGFSREKLREHIQQKDDFDFENHHMALIRHNNEFVEIHVVEVTEEDLMPPYIITAQHNRKEYKVSAPIMREKINNTEYSMKIILDKYNCHPDAYDEYVMDRHSKGVVTDDIEELLV
jgi:hypothetical protein